MEEETKKLVRNIVLTGDLSKDFVDVFMDAANEYWIDSQGAPRKRNIVIYLSSGGGSIAGADIMADTINQEPERYRMVAVEQIQSSAFRLFFKTRCDKCLVGDVTGMYHLPRESMDMSYNGKPFFDVDKFSLKEYPQLAKDELNWCDSLGISPEKMEIIAKGGNAYFSHQELQEIIELQRNELLEEARQKSTNGEATERPGESREAGEVVREQDTTEHVNFGEARNNHESFKLPRIT